MSPVLALLPFLPQNNSAFLPQMGEGGYRLKIKKFQRCDKITRLEVYVIFRLEPE